MYPIWMLMDVFNVIVTSNGTKEVIGYLQTLNGNLELPSQDQRNTKRKLNKVDLNLNEKLNAASVDVSKTADNPEVLNSKTVYRILRPEELCLKPPAAGKPQQSAKKSLSSDEEESVVPRKVVRTRSGRLTKLPAYLKKEENVEVKPTADTARTNDVSTRLVPPLEHPKRTVASQYRCLTCNKAYLGKCRMAKHLQLNPDHKAPTPKPTEEPLWSILVHRAQSAPPGEQIQVICKEILNVLQKARNLIPPLLTPADDPHCYEVDDLLGAGLGVAPGRYSLPEKLPNENSIPANDHNSLLNLLDTGQVVFDTSNEEEVMKVDQLVNERLKNFTGELEAPAINNAHNMNLDLSLDMFYHTNNV